MESEQCDGREAEVCVRVPTAGANDDGTVRALWNRTGDGVYVAEAIPGGGTGRAAGKESSSGKTQQPDSSRDRADGAGFTASPHELGTEEAETGSGAR